MDLSRGTCLRAAARRAAVLSAVTLAVVLVGCAPDPPDKDRGPQGDSSDTDGVTQEPPPVPSDLGLRLLTRGELDHAVQDLLGVELDPSTSLPDPVDRGYATDVRAGSVDESLVEGMLLAAEQVVTSLEAAAPQHTVVVEMEDLPVAWADTLTAAGGETRTWVYRLDTYALAVPFRLPVDGRWRLSLRVGFITSDGESPLAGWDPFVLAGTLDGVDLGGVAVPTYGTGGLPTELEVDATAGPHLLELRVAPSHTRVAILDSLTVTPAAPQVGPLARVDGCRAVRADALASCVADVLRPLAHLAWRRPLEPDDERALGTLLLAEAARGSGAREVFAQGLRALLAAPPFWFVVEGGEGTLQGDRYLLSPREVAVRLALLLWQSLPDEALLACAEEGGLGPDDAGACGLAAQVDRLLADPRALRLVEGFATAWLALDRLDTLPVDAEALPEVDRGLVASLRQESELLLEEILFGGGTLDELVGTRAAWVDRRLADHYGLPQPDGSGFQRMIVPEDAQGGLLRAGGVLLSTANPSRASDVRRGELVLSAFACEPPDPAPAVLPVVEAPPGEERQAIVEQTASPACATCHATLNPWGVALSRYDVAGRLLPEPAVTLPEGDYDEVFADVGALVSRLQTGQVAARCFTRHLASWATGRGLAAFDPEVMAAIETDTVAGGTTLRAAIHAIVRSPAFLSRPAGAP